jgi:hypothetical protein
MPPSFEIKYFCSEILSSHDCLFDSTRAHIVFKHSLVLCAGGASISIPTPQCRNYKNSPAAIFLLPIKLL